MRLLALAGTALALVMGVTSCGGDDDQREGTRRVLIYLLRGEEIGAAARSVPGGPGVERAAIDELLTGANTRETAAGLRTAIPATVGLNGVEIEDGIATVDLSGGFDDPEGADAMVAAGLPQIVFTVTQFPGIDAVRVVVDGQPLTFFAGGGAATGELSRAAYENLSPAILAETPAVGDVVSSPMRLQGTANTFEANFEYEVLVPDGPKLAGTFVTATCGTGCRGTFDEQVTFDAGDADTIMLVVLERSAEDGSRINEVEIPLDLAD